MSRHNPFINPTSGLPECLYAGCGREIPSDHYLCKTHYARLSEGSVGPCPGQGCKRFKSSEYDCCADLRQAAWSRSATRPGTPATRAAAEFFAYLLVSPTGDWYPGQTRSLRNRVWMHQVGRCKTTQDGGYRLVWFEVFTTRAEAAARELELKRLVVTDPYAVLDLVFAFQDRIALVRSLGPP